MTRETYKGRKITARALKGHEWGTVRATVNGHAWGPYQRGQSEEQVIADLRSWIDAVDSFGIDGDRFEAFWYAPGTYETCDEGHPREIGGQCKHTFCMENAA